MQCGILNWLLEQKKVISGKIENPNKVYTLVSCTNVNFLVLTSVSLHKMLILEEGE